MSYAVVLAVLAGLLAGRWLRSAAPPRGRSTRADPAVDAAERDRRVREHPGIVFRDGPVGWRPGLAKGPDVNEVVQVMRNLAADEPDPGPADLVQVTAEYLELTRRQVDAVVRYYEAYRAEIDDWIAAGEAVERREYAAWLAAHGQPAE